MLVAIFSFIYDYINIDKKHSLNNSTIIYSGKLFFFFWTMFVLVFVAGFREGVGTDYWAYARNFNDYSSNVWNSIINFDEPGIKIIAYISSLFHNHYGTMMLISSIITVGLSVYTIVKSSRLFFLSVLLYIFIGAWHGSFNGVRQYLAAAIIFFGHKHILNKEFKKYMIIIFIASIFHISALTMIVLYFVPKKKIKIYHIIILFLISLIGFFTYDHIFQIITSIFNVFRGTPFVMNEYVIRDVNFFRVLTAIAPVIFYVLFSNKKSLNNQDNFYINILFLNAMVFIISSNSAYLARFTIYTNIFTTIAFPRLLKGMNKNIKVLIIMLILFLYFIFWFIEVSSSPDLYNFNWIFNN